ncbi:MAG: formyltetrahydrofolate deformylase [Gammaproteobacteria bacterium]|jgi:formyltetrahydrofolate deformylase|nr:formyltetrahydrofolate deformylase [Chromatiales bacterium]MDP6675488.1 formyltetrahydrofolate deformylase [Gammaproteobacteria bacterium]
MSTPEHSFILTITCPDTVGIVAAVSSYLADRGYFIQASNHYGDPDTRQFFLRTHFTPNDKVFSHTQFAEQFAPIADKFAMDWHLFDQNILPRLLIVASKHEHCVNDLLYRYRTGALRMTIPAIVSNHLDLAPLAEWHRIPYFHIPISPGTKPEAEQRLLEIIDNTKADLVVLARYMQVLSDKFCSRMAGHIINIHHSFLPGFKGAKPYHKAHEHGVKLIGATAHYVSPELDEGPIIEQTVERVDHSLSTDDLIAVGRDVESITLARAVKLHINHRVFLNGNKTVVFK